MLVDCSKADNTFDWYPVINYRPSVLTSARKAANSIPATLSDIDKPLAEEYRPICGEDTLLEREHTARRLPPRLCRVGSVLGAVIGSLPDRGVLLQVCCSDLKHIIKCCFRCCQFWRRARMCCRTLGSHHVLAQSWSQETSIAVTRECEVALCQT